MFFRAVGFVWCLLIAAGPELPAQTAESPPSPADAVAEIEARLEALDRNSDLSSEEKDGIRALYETALRSVNQAVEDDAKAAEYRTVLETGGAEIDRLKAETKKVTEAAKTADPAEEKLSAEGLVTLIPREKAALADLKAALAALGKERIEQESGRFATIQEEISAVRQEIGVAGQLKNLEPDPAEAADPLKAARRAVSDSHLEALRSRLNRLESEQLSFQPRLDLLRFRHENQTALANAATARLLRLETLANRLRSDRAKESQAETRDAKGDPAMKDPLARAVARENAALAVEFQAVAARIQDLLREKQGADGELKRLTERYESIRRQQPVEANPGAYSEILIRQRRSLPSLRSEEHTLSEVHQRAATARVRTFEIGEEIRQFQSVEAPEAILADVSPKAATPELQDHLDRKAGLLAELRESYRTLIGDLGDLETTRTLHRDRVGEFADYLDDRLFWVPSVGPIGVDSFTGLPAAVVALFSSQLWTDAGRILVRVPSHMPVSLIVVTLLVAALMLSRKKLHERLASIEKRVGKVKRDHWTLTLWALFISVLLAGGVPLALGYLSYALFQVPMENSRAPDLSLPLAWVAGATFFFGMVSQITRPGGPGTGHFGWDKKQMARLRVRARWLNLIWVPLTFLAVLVFNDVVADHFGSLGRLIFMASMLFVAYVTWGALHPSRGLLSKLTVANAGSWLARLKKFWFGLIIAMPLVLAVLAIRGYLTTALSLDFRFQLTLVILSGGILLYAILVRWFEIREKRDAQELHDKSAEAAASEASGVPQSAAPANAEESVVQSSQDRKKMTPEEAAGQTRRLLRFAVALAVIGGFWWVWSSALPVLRHLHQVPGFGSSVSLGDLLVSLVVVLAMTIVAKNVPGLLEVGILRRLPLAPGSAVAISTLIRYLIIAIGLVFLARIFAIEWSKLGWIAAALSVGLGFGLQEIVANFVSGIILLFERPIRVGDVVTVGDVTGAVSQIRIRATTITNWDRKEYIIPNKEFLTGTVMNWTLSNTTNRVVVHVGVAYGTDTEKARAMLLEVAAKHPDVLEDPPPVATFEAFGDSSLNMQLRCYLPTLDIRLQVITELHTRINDAFNAAGIEIAFPQRDLHLRSSDTGLSIGPPPEKPAGNAGD